MAQESCALCCAVSDFAFGYEPLIACREHGKACVHFSHFCWTAAALRLASVGYMLGKAIITV